MLTVDREFQYSGELFIKKSRTLNDKSNPKDDNVNWLFLKIEERQFSFVYKIDNPNEATYNCPFTIKMAFTMSKEIKELLKISEQYEVYRGQEYIGSVTIINEL